MHLSRLHPCRRQLAMWAAGCAVAFSLFAPPAVSWDGGGGESDTSSEIWIESLPPEGPAILGVNELDLTVRVPGYEPIKLAVQPIAIPGIPGWLGVPSSELGALLFVPLTPQVGEYLLGFLDFGVTVPLSYQENGCTFEGTNGTVAVSASFAPFSSQGPGGGGGPNICLLEVPRPDGEVGIRIEATCPAECSIFFQQFVNTKITWTSSGGASGGCPLPVPATGNDGKPQQCDGRRTYSDSTRSIPGLPAGDYPQEPTVPGLNPGETTHAMEDGPNLTPLGLQALELLIEGDHGFPAGQDVTSITLELRYTTYVWMVCPPMLPVIVGRVEWWYTRTYTIPPAHGPSAPGRLGGPNPPAGGGRGFPGGSPTVNMTPGQSMSPDHAAALDAYQTGDPDGAPSPW
ncbi:MAG: hypothetical protein JNK02_17260 [Planctomycetes bacterium]|nr:hypothetical protein [Planctomycetota bacterium]